ncbi:MAG TPA: dicarboxylate/amino acid:cation symporter [Verrucomicrobiae bacterium]|nr:dicarboxylate/amino acid:cation symporter [Verrucomicrobiae bacterium]
MKVSLPAFHWQIAIALALALVAGFVSGPHSAAVPVYDFLGTLFLNALKMIVVPLIVAAIINGLASARGGALGRMGALTFGYYALSGLIAILTGLLLVNLLTPGIVDGVPAKALMGLDASTADVQKTMSDRGAGDFAQVILLLFPPNIFAAAAQGQMLGVICFSLLFGYAVSRLPEALGKTQAQFWAGFYEVMLRLTNLIMRFAPIGVFGLVAEVIAQTGWDAVRPLAVFFVTVLAGLVAHALITLPLILRLVARVSPLKHYAAMAPALTTAFSTSSSAATLPVTLECIEERAKVPRRVSSFVLPIGANVNTDGSALYECVVVMFIAQAYGVDLSFAQQFVVVLGALLTGIGIAGIPSASLVGIAVILGAVGLPLEGIGLVLAVDRILDMCRTTVNVFGDSCGAVVVGRLSGEDGILGEKALKR